MTRRDPGERSRWSLGDYVITHDPAGWLIILVAVLSIAPRVRRWLFKNKP